MTPTPPTPPPTQPIPPITLTGHVTATNGGQPLAGLSVDLGGLSTVTDAGGGFSYQFRFERIEKHLRELHVRVGAAGAGGSNAGRARDTSGTLLKARAIYFLRRVSSRDRLELPGARGPA